MTSWTRSSVREKIDMRQAIIETESSAFEKMIEEAVILHKAGRFEAAIEKNIDLVACLEANAKKGDTEVNKEVHAMAVHNLGSALHQCGHFDVAKGFYSEAVTELGTAEQGPLDFIMKLFGDVRASQVGAACFRPLLSTAEAARRLVACCKESMHAWPAAALYYHVRLTLSSRCGAYFPQLEFMKHKITLATSNTIPKATVFLNGNGEEEEWSAEEIARCQQEAEEIERRDNDRRKKVEGSAGMPTLNVSLAANLGTSYPITSTPRKGKSHALQPIFAAVRGGPLPGTRECHNQTAPLTTDCSPRLRYGVGCSH